MPHQRSILATAETPLLDRLSESAVSRGPLRVPLESILSTLARGFWARGAATSPGAFTRDACRVLESRDVHAFWAAPTSIFASYEEICAAFRTRRSAGGAGSKTTPLPAAVLDAPYKLVIRDNLRQIEAVVVGERVYPKRGWVATLKPSYGKEMAFVLAGLLNSALGQVLYRRAADARGLPGTISARQRYSTSRSLSSATTRKPSRGRPISPTGFTYCMQPRRHCRCPRKSPIPFCRLCGCCCSPSWRVSMAIRKARLAG